jgi:hypothetical protein
VLNWEWFVITAPPTSWSTWSQGSSPTSTSLESPRGTFAPMNSPSSQSSVTSNSCWVEGMPRLFTVPAFVAAMLVALAGCAFSPTRDSTQVAPTYQVSPSTWRKVDEDILAASIAAKGEAGAYARTTMEEWMVVLQKCW